MKILIADDMEGITGVVDWTHVDPGHAEYSRFRKIMTAEVNAAVRGAFKGGATEVVIADGHDGARNVLIEELDPRAKLNTGSPSYLSMVQGVHEDVDGIMFVGYHARAGTLNAILCHTWTGQVTNVWLNGRVSGEFGVNASVAGSFGVPALMLTGDRAACAEACEWVPDIETVAVKTASGRYAAECLPPEVTHARIEETAEKAVRRLAEGKAPKAIPPTTPVTVRLELSTPNQADNAGLLPGAVRVDGRTVELVVPDMVTAYRAFRAMASLGH